MSEEKNIFERGTRANVRFNTVKGSMLIEDLWQLPLKKSMKINDTVGLYDIGKELHNQIKAIEEFDEFDGFFTKEEPSNSANSILRLKFDIVKHIIEVKIKEQKLALNKKIQLEEKKKIMRIIAQKEDESLKETDVEVLKEKLKKIDETLDN